MKTVVVADAKYRSAIPVTRALALAGYHVVLTQSSPESPKPPHVFFSKYAAETHMIKDSAKSETYADALIEILERYEAPILFCTGADSLRAVSANLERFAKYADFIISDISVIESLNDKEQVLARGAELGIPTPKQYSGTPDRFPVVIKPHCGEKFGLKAGDRYAIARDLSQFEVMYAKMQQYDPAPLVQELIEGDGFGACILIDKDGTLINAYCHRRVREYPISGGPSTCCDSIYDEKMINSAYKLLRSFGFCGMAMVEFKGEYLLEVNPRLWGSYPMSECNASRFTEYYARAAAGEKLEYVPCAYKTGVRMRFFLNDTVSILSHLKHGKIKTVFTGIKDLFTAKEALYDRKDKKPFFKYLKDAVLGK